ncbi:aminopeptidase [Eubacteriales bacterium OttesenSCG-928-M02]|nr:aminopeptidase [Eubacteriales bacterium OttesenSCG-928-M02]
MRDPRIEDFCDVLLDHSVKVQAGENIAINMRDYDVEMATALVEGIYKRGGRPFVNLSDARVTAASYKGMDETYAKLLAEFNNPKMERMQGYVSLVGGNNAMEMSNVPAEAMAIYRSLVWKPQDEIIRKNDIKWVVVEYPTPGAAQRAGMSTPEFEDFFFDACCVDYEKMSKGMDVLVQWMERTDRVHITGPGTDLTLSIKGQPAIKCDGVNNVPDGEVFTGPIKDSIDGVVSFNVDSVEGGFQYSNIQLTFEKGKCVKATANDGERINKTLDTDEGARYVGEFALGVNPAIKRPMLSTLFDEKIAGSFHMALGACYDDAPNGNESAIHWDMICIQTKEYGGGEITFDDVLVRKDGMFLPKELQGLNP